MPSLRFDIRLTALAFLLMLGSSCESGITSPMSELAIARARWSSAAPISYSVVISRACLCVQAANGPVLVTVRNGVAQSRQYTQTGTPVTSTFAGQFPTVEELFSIIEEAVRAGIQPIDVQYDPTLGYPTRALIGDTSADGGAAYYASDVHAQ